MLAAIREGHAASIRYLDPRSGEEIRRTIEAVGLVCRGDAWWLVAWCPLRNDARAFRVENVSEWIHEYWTLVKDVESVDRWTRREGR